MKSGTYTVKGREENTGGEPLTIKLVNGKRYVDADPFYSAIARPEGGYWWELITEEEFGRLVDELGLDADDPMLVDVYVTYDCLGIDPKEVEEAEKKL